MRVRIIHDGKSTQPWGVEAHVWLTHAELGTVLNMVRSGWDYAGRQEYDLVAAILPLSSVGTAPVQDATQTVVHGQQE